MPARNTPSAEARLLKLAAWFADQGEPVTREAVYGAFPDDYAGTPANQLTTWNHIGLFDRDIGPASAYGALPSPYGTQGTLATRARGWKVLASSLFHRGKSV